jgi:hypothetical protein
MRIGSNPLSSNKECMRHADECVRLAGLTHDLSVRNQLLELAQDWIAAAQRERPRSDDAQVGPIKRQGRLSDKGDDARVVVPSRDDGDDAKVIQLRDDESKD